MELKIMYPKAFKHLSTVPWHASNLAEHAWVIDPQGNYLFEAMIEDEAHKLEIDPDKRIANATLAAAAPDMADALISCAMDCKMALAGTWDRGDDGFEATLHMIETVLKQAGIKVPRYNPKVDE